MKAYELHTFSNGQWTIDSIYDDRDLALFEARRIDENTRSRFSGIRVIEETFEPDSNLTKTRTIFRGGKAERQEKARKAEARQKATSAPAGAKGREPAGKRQPRPPPKKSSAPVLIMMFVVIVLGGLAAMIGLKHLSL